MKSYGFKFPKNINVNNNEKEGNIQDQNKETKMIENQDEQTKNQDEQTKNQDEQTKNQYDDNNEQDKDKDNIRITQGKEITNNTMTNPYKINKGLELLEKIQEKRRIYRRKNRRKKHSFDHTY